MKVRPVFARSTIGGSEPSAGIAFGVRRSAAPRSTGIGAANGSGVTALIAQTYNSTLGRYEFSGRQDTDATLIGSRYTITTITFSFPTSGSLYSGQGYGSGSEPDTQAAFNAQQKAAARYALGLVAQYTNLHFTETSETTTAHANLRFSQTGYAPVTPATANAPSSSAKSGDIWLNGSDPLYQSPALGNAGEATILRAIGQALGLKSGNRDYTTTNLAGTIDANPGGAPRYGSVALTADHDGQDWSLMTEASDPSMDPAAPRFEGDATNQPQTFMQDDIAALQYLYGANYGTQSGDTTYSWNSTTGRESINGVAQAAPTGNKIATTIWDGNGIDTYDLSNYTTGVLIDLKPGAFSTFSSAQLLNHQPIDGFAPATGNVANALLYQGNTQSLIENAKGGTSRDRIFGNDAANLLSGSNDNDILVGDAGNDTLYGDSGHDTLFGDRFGGSPSGVKTIRSGGRLLKPAGTGNSDRDHAIELTKKFGSFAVPDIEGSDSSPHLSIDADGGGTRDYYKLLLNAGALITLDIDHTSSGFDSFLRVYDSRGTLVAQNNDSAVSSGGSGSTTTSDAFLTFTALTRDTYYVEVGSAATTTTSGLVPSGATYQLQVTAADAAPSGGGSGDDILDGGGSDDVMYGGAGDDLYFVNTSKDVVVEYAGQGTDTIGTFLTYALPQFVENLSTTNASGLDPIGLYGNTLDNRISGNNGSNLLDGGVGADRMIGRLGDDHFYVDNVKDQTIEKDGEGTDTVFTSISYNLGSGQSIEFLATTNGAATTALDLVGNEIANTIDGNNGNNILDGKGGADTLRGLRGDDLYYVDNAADQVIEAANGGNDHVGTSVDYTLAAGQSIEQLSTTSASGTAAINLTGNEIDNRLSGNNGANILDGKGGSDRIYGRGGADVFAFSTTLGTGNVDTIEDFANSTNSVHDTISLSRAIFAQVGAGATLAGSAFKDITGGATVDASDRILYDHDSGALFYDADGSGSTAAVQFATLANLVTLTAADFAIGA